MPIVVLLLHALLPVMISKPVCAIMDTLEMEKPAKVEPFPKIRKLVVNIVYKCTCVEMFCKHCQ